MKSALTENTPFVGRGKKEGLCYLLGDQVSQLPGTWGLVRRPGPGGKVICPRAVWNRWLSEAAVPVPALPVSLRGQYWNLRPLRPDRPKPETSAVQACFLLSISVLCLRIEQAGHRDCNSGQFPGERAGRYMALPPPLSTSQEVVKARFCPDDVTSFSLFPLPSKHHLWGEGGGQPVSSVG